jgi:hypothetical protein
VMFWARRIGHCPIKYRKYYRVNPLALGLPFTPLLGTHCGFILQPVAFSACLAFSNSSRTSSSVICEKSL